MAINYPVLDFPKLPIEGQLFYAPGAAIEGGYTTGGVRMFSPEPGGRSYLEIKLSLLINEWTRPVGSWLMSKTNGVIFKTGLTKTPQLALSNVAGQLWNNDQPWDNNNPWSGTPVVLTTEAAQEGEPTIKVNMATYGAVLDIGHVIGFLATSYMVDAISYDGDIATITVNPPLRADVPNAGMITFRPFFTGTIMNGDDFRSQYQAAMNGHIELGTILMSEVWL